MSDCPCIPVVDPILATVAAIEFEEAAAEASDSLVEFVAPVVPVVPLGLVPAVVPAAVPAVVSNPGIIPVPVVEEVV